MKILQRPLLLFIPFLIMLVALMGNVQGAFAQSAFDCTAVTEIPTAECDTLVAFYNSTNGDNWEESAQSGWLETNTPCLWNGIGCADGHVSEIIMEGSDLSGTIPAEIGALTHLITIDIRYGVKINTLPPEIGDLINLRNLTIFDGNLTSLPPEIGNLVNLELLDLAHNDLTQIPAGIGSLTQLKMLTLSFNQLTGLPPEIGNLVNLELLDLVAVELTELPAEIGSLIQLKTLDLSGNQLTALPLELWGLANLELLNLTYNQLTQISSEIGSLAQLKTLDLSSNQLTELPPELWGLTNLDLLNLGWNQFTQIPAEIGSLTQLKMLTLNGNPLTRFPPELLSLINLEQLELSAIELTALPAEIGILTQLQHLELEGNQLTELPSEVWGLVNLEMLDLGYNQFAQIPAEIGALTQLQTLNLSGNRLREVPSEITDLINLQSLRLSHNALNVLPDEIGNLTNLVVLYIGDNPLTAWPQTITNLNLERFEIDNLCEPDDLEIQTWLDDATFLFLNPTSTKCSDVTISGQILYGDPAMENTQPVPNPRVELVTIFSGEVITYLLQSDSNGQYGNAESMHLTFNTYTVTAVVDGVLQQETVELSPWYHDITVNFEYPYPIAETSFDCTAVIEIPLSECEALVTFYNSMKGQAWSAFAQRDWLETSTPCTWRGVSCTDGHVTQLIKDGFSARVGVIPAELEALTHLTHLHIGYMPIAPDSLLSLIHI